MSDNVDLKTTRIKFSFPDNLAKICEKIDIVLNLDYSKFGYLHILKACSKFFKNHFFEFSLDCSSLFFMNYST